MPANRPTRDFTRPLNRLGSGAGAGGARGAAATGAGTGRSGETVLTAASWRTRVRVELAGWTSSTSAGVIS
ncbi:hypothetical protein D9M71_719470 [compost metagenome]